MATTQRSFRLKPATLELLDEHARDAGISANALAQRLLDESLRVERHPLIGFREGGSGARFPALVGRRLSVWDVMGTVWAEGGDIAATGEYLQISQRDVQACVDYYADFREEVDAYGAEHEAAAERVHRQLERRRAAVG
jgi:uncharacterized protein (DUF433 family)